MHIPIVQRSATVLALRVGQLNRVVPRNFLRGGGGGGEQEDGVNDIEDVIIIF